MTRITRTTFKRDGAYVSPRPGDTQHVYIQELGVSTQHSLLTQAVRSCSVIVWYVPLLAICGLAHIMGGVSDVDADKVGDMDVAVADVVARQVEPAIHAAARYGLPFDIHIGHGYNTPDNLPAGMHTWLADYAADPAHHATLHVSTTFRRYSRQEIPWGSTRVSIDATTGDLLVEERVRLFGKGPSKVFVPPPGESAILPGYNGPGLMFRSLDDGKMWELVDRQTCTEFLVSKYREGLAA